MMRSPGARERPNSTRRAWLPRIGAALVLVALVALALRAGVVDFLRDGDRVEVFLTESGPIGPLAFVSVFTLAQPFSIPGVAMIIPATFVWSGPVVFALSWTGGMIASTVGFAVARWFARDWVQQRLTPSMRSWGERLEEHGTRAVILLRVVTGYAPMADWLLGVSSINLRQFFVGTAIGLVPTTAIASFLGDDALRFAARLPWVAAGLIVLAGLVVWKRRRRPQPRPEPHVTDDDSVVDPV